MKTAMNAFITLVVGLSGCWVAAIHAETSPTNSMTPAADSMPTVTVDWIDLENRKLVAGDRTVLLSLDLHVYSADGKPLPEKSLVKGTKVVFKVVRSQDAPHPMVREIHVLKQE